jgi:sugar lactone lactonase YvrE
MAGTVFVNVKRRAGNGLLALAAIARSVSGQTAVHQVAAPNSELSNERAPLAIFGPGVLAADGRGNTYVVVWDGVFKIDHAGLRSRIGGIEGRWRYSGDGGPAIGAGMNPRSVAVDSGGNLYLADAGNNRVRKLTAATGIVTTVAGNGIRGHAGDGAPAPEAQLDGPTGVAIDREGNLYISDGTADGKNRIRKVAAATGVITTVAGNGSQGYSGDGGPATRAQISSLGGLAADAVGNVYIADNFNNRIRMVSAATGIITTVAGNGADQLNNPLSVAVDIEGNIFIADSGNYRIRKVTAATGEIHTVGSGDLVFGNAQHGFPCSLALDAAGNLYVADSGISRIRRLRAGRVIPSLSEADHPAVQNFAGSGFKILVSYDSSVPAPAQAAFNSVVSAYESIFTTNITVNINVTFGTTGLGASLTQQQFVTYAAWRSAMIANANNNPGNVYAVAAAASLPASDPIGSGNVLIATANARALGITANTPVDSTLTFSDTAVWEYNGIPSQSTVDFMDTAAHELDEALGIGSALTGLADNAAIPTDDYVPEDYFRYSAVGVRAITTNPNAFVYFSYNGGNTNVAQFNQAYSAQGDFGLDRNDWIYGNFGCPAGTVYVQDAISCYGQAVPVGSGPEITVLSTLGYDSSVSQTITFPALGNVTYGVAPFSISATASSGLAVVFNSNSSGVCTVSGSMVTIIAAGGCSITANQPGNATYSAAPSVTRSFTVNKAAQTISFGALPNVTYGVAPFGISATATSGLAVTFASTTTSICTVSGSTVTIVGIGKCSITASQAGNANFLAATPVIQSFTVNAGVAPAGVNPASGSGLTKTFTFTFTDVAGYADLNVLDVLISTFLDGQTACYFALAPTGATTGYLYLVDDAGDGGYAPGTPMPLPSTGVLQNSQCALNGTGSSIAGSGNTLTLTLAITFKSGFSGNKAVYMAARSKTQNSGWQAIGTWNVPGATVGPAVGTVTPGRSTTTGQTYTFTFTDSNGFADLFVLDILTNSFLDGISACYIAYVPTTPTNGYVYLVDDAGDGGYAPGSPVGLSSGSLLQNSQCAINTAASSASGSGNTLTLNLALTFKTTFAGNQVFFLAARNNSTGNSGWQAAGSVTVP